MDTLRRVLWLSLAIILVWLWQAWQQDYGIHSIHRNSGSTVQKVLQAPPALIQSPTLEKTLAFIPKERQITFETDVLRGVIDTQGGHLVYLALLNYPASIHTKEPFVLLDHRDSRYYTAQTDLLKPGETQTTKKESQYQTKQSNYLLSPDKEAISITLHRQENGVNIAKQFLLKKGQYQIDLSYTLDNRSKLAYKARPYAELVQQKPSQRKNWLSNTAYSGGIISSDDKRYQKVSFDDLGKKHLPNRTKQAWLSFVEPYFASAWISKLPNIAYYSQQHRDTYMLGMLGDYWEINPGENLTGELSLYAGPKVAEKLKMSGQHLDLLVDYGIFWFIATNLFWLLKQCYYWLGNWGWAIVCATILLKLSLYHVSAKQFRTTIAMRRLQAKLDDLKVRHADNQQALNQATLELYRREGINPIGGTLIAFIQLPISLALNAVLLESIELRHEPFILWISDLAATDSYYILPFLLGLTMFIELFIDQALAAKKDTDGFQFNTILLFVPLVFTLVATNFPTGLALYWFVQNVLSSIQKWWLLGKPLPSRISVLLKKSC